VGTAVRRHLPQTQKALSPLAERRVPREDLKRFLQLALSELKGCMKEISRAFG
jgi:hypothetical protein